MAKDSAKGAAKPRRAAAQTVEPTDDQPETFETELQATTQVGQEVYFPGRVLHRDEAKLERVDAAHRKVLAGRPVEQPTDYSAQGGAGFGAGEPEPEGGEDEGEGEGEKEQ